MDERFKQVLTDPRFRTLKRSERKVQLDGRFSRLLTDRRFRTQSDVDPRVGRLTTQAHVEEHLESYYDTTPHEVPPPRPAIPLDVRGIDEQESQSSSSDESSSDEEVEEVEHDWAELDKDVVRSSDISRRLAVCNVDWDRIKAQDLFVLVNSFTPGGGSVLSVRIFASDFGKKRMAEEEVRGPIEVVATPVIDDDDDDDGDPNEDSEQQEYMQEKLRRYQLNRLKYFYAIVECDSAETANSLYEQLDNFEFESSASTLDLRFVPDSETFEEAPVQVCSSLPDFATYKAPIFITSALQQSSVNLTWDETDPTRVRKIESAFASRDEKQLDDLQVFLASDESSDSEEEEPSDTPAAECKEAVGADKLNKYKELLRAVEQENQDQDADIEITFDGQEVPGQEAGSDSNSSCEESADENASAAADEKEADPTLELLVMEDNKKRHFTYSDFVEGGRKMKKKRKKGKTPVQETDDFSFDDSDARFSRIFSSPDFNIDPSNPHFKKTPAMLSLLQRKTAQATRVDGHKGKAAARVALREATSHEAIPSSGKRVKSSQS